MALWGGSGALLLTFFIRAIERLGRDGPGEAAMATFLLVPAGACVIPAFGLVWLLFNQKLEKHKLWLIVSTPLVVLLALGAGVLAAPSFF